MTMIARSVSVPRTYATAIAAMIASTVSRIRIGSITVSVAGRRVRKMLLIASPVAQLLPQLNVKIDFTKIQSWHVPGIVEAELLANRLRSAPAWPAGRRGSRPDRHRRT